MTNARGTLLGKPANADPLRPFFEDTETEIAIPGHSNSPWAWTGRVIPDGWEKAAGVGVPTTPSGYTEFDFYMERSEVPTEAYGVKLRVTGRTVQGYGSATGPRIRCQIEFVGDGVPSRFHGGWLMVR